MCSFFILENFNNIMITNIHNNNYIRNNSLSFKSEKSEKAMVNYGQTRGLSVNSLPAPAVRANLFIPYKGLNTISRDNFTGLRDKQSFFVKLPQKIKQAERSNKNLKIAMFDMDNFKSVNELLGYEVGDKFIKEIAGVIQENSRKNSLGSYRFGGEEFIIMFVDQNNEETEQICGNILKELNNNGVLTSYNELYQAAAIKSIKEYEGQNVYTASLKKYKSDLDCLSLLAEKDPDLLKNETFRNEIEKDKKYSQIMYGIALIKAQEQIRKFVKN